jgi:hypothetical protein
MYVWRNTGAFVKSLLQWKSNKCYIFWVCICIPRYPNCNMHVPYCHLWPVRLIQKFSTLSQKTARFSKKKATENKTCFDFLYNLCVSFGERCWWGSWLRHCATSRKVAGSIPDGVIGFFHWHNLSGRSMALGSTQPLTKMSTRNVYWR